MISVLLSTFFVRADIHIVKVNEQHVEEVLPDSTYGLFITDTNGEKLIATNKTDDKGELVFEGVLTEKEYTIRELIAPDGCYVSKDPIKVQFRVDEDGKVVFDPTSFDSGKGTVTIDENGNITWLEPSVIVSFDKVDQDGKPVKGAVLQVVDENDKIVVDAWTTDGTTKVVEKTFVIGHTYKLIELSAPNGYKLADPVVFTISDAPVAAGENEAYKVTMVDEKEKKEDKTENKDTKPKTGDESNAPLAGLMLLLSMIGMAGIIALKKKENDFSEM